MNLAALDLNLLVALDALLSQASVSRAAKRIGLSQPATSHALRRLREMMDDPLLVRVGAGMELTPRAHALRAPLAETLAHVRGLFVAEDFEPATSQRRFSLMMPDHVFDLILPPLVAGVAAQAPGVRLDVRPWRGPGQMTPDLARNIDLVIACADDDFPGFHRRTLFRDTDTIAARKGHPALPRLGELQTFLATGHVAVVGYGQRVDPIDTWLEEHRVARRIALTAPSYLQALHMVSLSDLIAVVPRRQIVMLAQALGLEILAPPIDPGSFEEYMFHPLTAQTDPASIWLRTMVAEVAAGLAGNP
ncbi:LysR family transcriptional regulator [Phenylobacterium sp.]|uniref:LysR family transcriptional regulator n=1 Tax=Phenylobacterium sp. TaxID=1871053 RepID=UPI002FCA5CB2